MPVRTSSVLVAVAVAVVLSACTGGADPDPDGADGSVSSTTGAPSDPATSGPTTPPPPTTAPPSSATPGPADVDGAAAMDTVTYLSATVGRRHATSQAYRRAADWVDQRFTALGYTVTRQPVRVPAGNTWGVDVPAGTAESVIADPPGFDPQRPHAVVGAHLDTIPRAPGAEDNASGVALVLEVARLARQQPPTVPVRFVAFAAEEPRGPSDDDHHYGSQEYVAQLDAAERRALVGALALDRVGVRGPEVPICNGSDDTRVRRQLVQAARAADVPHTVCGDNRTSDHWSFERNDLPGARLGSIPYAGYHSPQDTADVVSRNQLVRTGRIAWSWVQRNRS